MNKRIFCLNFSTGVGSLRKSKINLVNVIAPLLQMNSSYGTYVICYTANTRKKDLNFGSSPRHCCLIGQFQLFCAFSCSLLVPNPLGSHTQVFTTIPDRVQARRKGIHIGGAETRDERNEQQWESGSLSPRRSFMTTPLRSLETGRLNI